jgi:hypothetical protein
LAKLALSRLPWAPSETMATEIGLIRLALDGVEEREHQLFTVIFAAQGHVLPPLERNRPDQRVSAEQIKGWAAAINARMAANRRAKEAAKGGKAAPTVRPGGGAPPRPSKRASKKRR